MHEDIIILQVDDILQLTTSDRKLNRDLAKMVL